MKRLIILIVTAPPIPVQKKLVTAVSDFETYRVKIRYTANMIAPMIAKTDPSEITFVVGLKITITPINPMNIANHLLHPNFSPRKGTDKPATING